MSDSSTMWSDKSASERHHTGRDFLLSMASLAFVFVILAGIGSALTALSSSLSLPWGEVVRILGGALQVFAAVWFIVLAVTAWVRFVKADNAANVPPPRAT
jgi:hypothetical protein